MKLPISLMFMTSTKGHFGHKEVYLSTLNHLDRQIPLSYFRVKVAHIKITPGEEVFAQEMRKKLETFGFEVMERVAAWSRGQSHQQEYMKDLIKVSKNEKLYRNNFVLWLEDDSTMYSEKDSLERILTRMVLFLENRQDTASARFLRKGDFSTSPILKEEGDFFWSPHFNFQPSILRSRDFYLGCKAIEDNFNNILNIQSEMLWRLVLAPFSRSELKHIVWHPDYAETHHLGSPEYPELKKKLNL